MRRGIREGFLLCFGGSAVAWFLFGVLVFALRVGGP
jgi:hypothetical protein